MKAHLSLVSAALFALLCSCQSGGTPRTVRSGEGDFGDVPNACVGGLCVKPDHVSARKDGPKGRCLVMAWDGSTLPPTAKMGAYDDSPSRPGIFAVVDVPSLRDGMVYPVVANPDDGGSASAGVFAVRVDPAARFADHRIADKGDVTIVRSGSDAIINVKTRWGEKTESATFVLSKAHNGCTSAF